MSTNLRTLRIAFSILCGIVCLLLIVLWLRSQSLADSMGSIVTDRYASVISTWPGSCGFRIADDTFAMKPWKWRSDPVRDEDRELLGSFHWPDDSAPYLIVPYWLLVLVAAMLVPVPWFNWPQRFSLSTLLIATTLVAVMLGSIVYAIR